MLIIDTRISLIYLRLEYIQFLGLSCREEALSKVLSLQKRDYRVLHNPCPISYWNSCKPLGHGKWITLYSRHICVLITVDIFLTRAIYPCWFQGFAWALSAPWEAWWVYSCCYRWRAFLLSMPRSILPSPRVGFGFAGSTTRQICASEEGWRTWAGFAQPNKKLINNLFETLCMPDY